MRYAAPQSTRIAPCAIATCPQKKLKLSGSGRSDENPQFNCGRHPSSRVRSGLLFGRLEKLAASWWSASGGSFLGSRSRPGSPFQPTTQDTKAFRARRRSNAHGMKGGAASSLLGRSTSRAGKVAITCGGRSDATTGFRGDSLASGTLGKTPTLGKSLKATQC